MRLQQYPHKNEGILVKLKNTLETNAFKYYNKECMLKNSNLFWILERRG